MVPLRVVENKTLLEIEAQRMLGEINRRARKLTISGPFNPLLEKGVVISTPYGVFVIDSISAQGDNKDIGMTVECVLDDYTDLY